jgi:DNA invertase Pin-like site-specific DNA recombinase
MMALFAEIERDLVSVRTKEALKARKAKGVKLGRPKGPGKSRLDQFRPEIEALLKNGSTKAYVSRRYKVSEPTLFNWLKKNRIEIKLGEESNPSSGAGLPLDNLNSKLPLAFAQWITCCQACIWS